MCYEFYLVLTRENGLLCITFRKIKSQRWKFAEAQAALAANANLNVLFNAVRFENKKLLGTIVLVFNQRPDRANEFDINDGVIIEQGRGICMHSDAQECE
jgi:hypothetical protein